jgi:hypothetical protein
MAEAIEVVPNDPSISTYSYGGSPYYGLAGLGSTDFLSKPLFTAPIVGDVTPLKGVLLGLVAYVGYGYMQTGRVSIPGLSGLGSPMGRRYRGSQRSRNRARRRRNRRGQFV